MGAAYLPTQPSDPTAQTLHRRLGTLGPLHQSGVALGRVPGERHDHPGGLTPGCRLDRVDHQIAPRGAGVLDDGGRPIAQRRQGSGPPLMDLRVAPLPHELAELTGCRSALSVPQPRARHQCDGVTVAAQVGAEVLVHMVQRPDPRVRPAHLVEGPRAHQHPLAGHPVEDGDLGRGDSIGVVGRVPPAYVVDGPGPTAVVEQDPARLIDTQAAERRDLRVEVGGIHQRVEPPGLGKHVVLDEHEELAPPERPQAVQAAGPPEVGGFEVDPHAVRQLRRRLSGVGGVDGDTDDEVVPRVVGDHGLDALPQSGWHPQGHDPEVDAAVGIEGAEHPWEVTVTGVSRLAIGIDIGGTGIKAAPVDLVTGDLAGDRQRTATPRPATPQAVAEVLVGLLGRIDGGTDQAGDEGAIGITVPGVVRHGVVHSAANIDPSWIDTDADALFSEATGREVHVLNDADAAGLAEVRYGAARGRHGLVIVTTLGTGIGGALVHDGVLVPNAELGHLEIDGRNAESHAANSARQREGLSFPEWAARLQRYYETLEMLFSPDLFVVGGGVSKQAEEFLPLLDLRTEIVPAALRNQAGIVGAAYYASLGGDLV